MASDYLTRLQATRAMLSERALSAEGGRLPLVCPQCHGETCWIGGEEQTCWCTPCRRAVEPPLSIVAVIAELDRAIAWAKQVKGWRQRV